MKVTEELIERINTELTNHFVEISRVKKNNVEKTGLVIIPKAGERDVCPTVYIDDLDDESEVIDRVKSCANIPGPKIDFEEITSREYILNNLRACMVSRDNILLQQNDIVYRPFLDMAIIYRIIVINEENRTYGGILIKEDLLEDAGLKEEDLFEVARKNTDYQMKTILQELVELSSVNQSKLDEIEGDIPNVFVITTRDKIHGSSVIFTDILKEFREKLGEDFYILPASIHEVIIVPFSLKMKPEDLLELVQTVNANEVQPEDMLTNSVYCMDENGVKKVA